MAKKTKEQLQLMQIKFDVMDYIKSLSTSHPTCPFCNEELDTDDSFKLDDDSTNAVECSKCDSIYYVDVEIVDIDSLEPNSFYEDDFCDDDSVYIYYNSKDLKNTKPNLIKSKLEDSLLQGKLF
jgi:transcription elongation factor Elf1